MTTSLKTHWATSYHPGVNNKLQFSYTHKQKRAWLMHWLHPGKYHTLALFFLNLPPLRLVC